MTYALILGAGGSAWYWHRVAPLLPDAIAIELPAHDDSADQSAYADTVVDAVSGVSGGAVILVAQSMGAFTAPIVASRMPVASIVLVNPMVPTAGESPGQWWAATGHDQVVHDFDPVEDSFTTCPTRCAKRRSARGAAPVRHAVRAGGRWTVGPMCQPE
jgi:pimeloyl-ACP methyl ester carboxylesterase